MNAHICYNKDFSDEDVARLCQYAPYANDPKIRYYTCLWETGGIICHSQHRASEFPDHLRSDHGVVGPDKAQLTCCWVKCFTEIGKESMMRHVNEQHLELKHVCPTCNEQFTRALTMQNHMSKKHSGD